MSLGQVGRAAGSGRSVIVKSSPDPAEARFFARVAPRLTAAGIAVPTCV